ncbi:DUF1707 domain-containing protein [Pseudonocardia nematodicida]|uniref:DUF1707 domain-containing protein n=1 Tax=Pseudonocardia nematodicida TaxID=1206997 RepID=A0ABV1K850_9PSEU
MSAEGDYRISDDERRAVDARLQRAHGDGRLSLEEYEERSASAWEARTRTDLEPLTRDLPPDPADERTAAPALSTERAPSRAGDFAAAAGRRVGGAIGAVVLVAAAVWGAPQLFSDGVTVFGSRTVGVAPGADQVRSGVLFGSVRVVVPDGERAQLGGFTLFSSTECPTACTGAAARTIDVGVSSVFGSVEVLTPAEAANPDRDDDPGDELDDD